jgi:UDP-N-acetyl-D-glucosamine/UDP-N-acetyl-D-galactosamine dehydrogenase
VMSVIPAGGCSAAVVAAVAHRQFAALSLDHWQQLLTPSGVLLDLKGIVPRELAVMRL